MKRIISLITVLILLFTCVPTVSGAYTSGKYLVVKDVTGVYASPSITAEKTAELTKNTYIEITEIRNDTFGKAYIAKDGITGWVQMGALTIVSTPAENSSVKGIEITSLPKKLSYLDGKEELDLTGMTVCTVDEKGKRTEISSYNVYAPEMKTPGEKTVRVTYSPDRVNTYSDEFTVTVTRLPVKSISIVNEPKSVYLEHYKLDLSALSVKTEFKNSADNKTYTYEQIKNDPDFIIEGCHGESHGSVLEKGTHTFRVYYKYTDIFCTFTVEVAPRQLVSLTMKQPPENLTVYDNTKIPALDGIILEAAYDNGEKEDIYHYDCTGVCDPSKFVIGPGNKVDVYFGELFVTVEFRYSIAVPAKIVIEFPKDEEGNVMPLTHLKGEPFDLDGIRVRLVYTDDTYAYVDDFEMSKVDYTVIGTQNITVKYKEFSEVFSIVISPYFSKGDIDGDGKITAYDARQTLRCSVGLTTLAGDLFFAGDADRNGTITANDARLILRASVDLENLYLTM